MARRLIDQYGYSKDLMQVLLGGWNGWNELNAQEPKKYPIEKGTGGASLPPPEATGTVEAVETPTTEVVETPTTLTGVIVTPQVEGTATAQAFATETGGLNFISVEGLKVLQATGDVTVIDVRSTSRYDSQHIKGAISVQGFEILDRLEDVPKEGNVVLYCQ